MTRNSVEEQVQGPSGEMLSLELALEALRGELDLVRNLSFSELGAAESGEEAGLKELRNRFRGMESAVAELQSAMDGIDVGAASARREELFRGADGDVKAAEYFEAGKFSIAGEGYLTFLASHPDHPEHRSIVERARQAFVKAGNLDKAMAVQKELMEMYPENRSKDLMTLAHLQKESGDYAAAASSAEESAGMLNDSSKYWNLLYSAWYTQLGDGLDAGLQAHLNLQQQLSAAGHTDGKLSERVQEKITEIENQIAAEGR